MAWELVCRLLYVYGTACEINLKRKFQQSYIKEPRHYARRGGEIEERRHPGWLVHGGGAHGQKEGTTTLGPRVRGLAR
jgi:hypothetical protein